MLRNNEEWGNVDLTIDVDYSPCMVYLDVFEFPMKVGYIYILVTKGLATRSKDVTSSSWQYY